MTTPCIKSTEWVPAAGLPGYETRISNEGYRETRPARQAVLPSYRAALAQAKELLSEAARRITQNDDSTLRYKIEEFVEHS